MVQNASQGRTKEKEIRRRLRVGFIRRQIWYRPYTIHVTVHRMRTVYGCVGRYLAHVRTVLVCCVRLLDKRGRSLAGKLHVYL